MMSSNSIKTRKKKSSEDTVINRLMIVFVVATLSIIGLVMINQNARVMKTFMTEVLPWARIITGVIVAAALAFFVYCRVREISEDHRLVTSGMILAFTAIVFGVLMIMGNVTTTTLVVTIIAITALAFIRGFYPVNFYSFSVLTVVEIFLLNMAKRAAGVSGFGLFKTALVLAYVLPALSIAFLVYLYAKKGVLKIGKKNLPIMGRGDKYYPFVVSACVMIAAALAITLYSTWAVYAMIAVGAVYLLMGMVYTVKMM